MAARVDYVDGKKKVENVKSTTRGIWILIGTIIYIYILHIFIYLYTYICIICKICKSDRITTLNSCWFHRLLVFNP